jgi:hypothetical protein
VSTVQVQDQGKETFSVVIRFSYEECDRLPYNALRGMRATIRDIPEGGVEAQATFRLEKKEEAALFLGTLRHFCADGPFARGAPTQYAALAGEDGSSRAAPKAEARVEVVETADTPPPSDEAPWMAKGDRVVDESLAANEDRPQTLARLEQQADKRYSKEMARRRVIQVLHAKFGDAEYVASVLKRRGWGEIAPKEVASLAGRS